MSSLTERVTESTEETLNGVFERTEAAPLGRMVECDTSVVIADWEAKERVDGVARLRWDAADEEVAICVDGACSFPVTSDATESWAS
eukprot:gene8399-biopygen5752